MRPPPRPNQTAISRTGRSQSPAESLVSSSSSRARSPSSAPSAGMKRKERDFDRDGEETNIHVVVRCRGRSDREVRENSGVVVSTQGTKGKNVELIMGPNALSNKTYHFDKVFSPAADQSMIFEDVVTPILSEMLLGYNCTIFAYGQTGTGKTYTMSGDMTDTMGILSDNAGIIPRTLYSLFQKLENEEAECSVKCSFIELYNEELRDLLAADDSVKLKIYEDSNSKKGHTATMVQGMEESHIKTANAGIKLLQQGSYRRQVAATKCNDLSSRSHTVFTITTYMKKTAETGEDFICAGKLNLVDLAGSENIQRSGAENKRAAEAGLINKSLLTLGRVINALVDKGSHIPYRESKLTRLLQDSLGGRTKTCLIATLSPAKSNLEETISTLDYAFRAKNIRNKPQVNSMISKKTLLREFTAEIEKLKSELIATRQRNGVYLTNEQYEEMTVESESRRILAEEQKARIETMEASLRNKVQELFSLTSNFNHLRKDHESTRLALENTEDVLQKTEIVLRDTKQMLEEETELRKAYQATEAELQTLSKQLISTVGHSVKDLDGVHSKLRRRSDLHALNKENWEATSSKVVNISRLVDSTIESFQVEQSQQLASLSSRVNAFVASEVQHAESAQQDLIADVAKFEETHDGITQQGVKSRDDMNEVLEEIKVLREEVKTQVGEGLNGLSAAAARISGEVIAELDQFHAQLHSSYSSLGRDFKSIFETLVQHIQAQKKEADYLREQVQLANQRSLQASRDAANSLKNSLEVERVQAQKERQGLFEKMQALVEESAVTQDSRWSAAIGSTTENLEVSNKEFEEANLSYGKGMDEWTDKEQIFADEIVKSRDTLKTKMKRDWTSISEHNTAIQTSTKAVHEETVQIVDAQIKDMAVQMAALDEFVTRARSQNGEQHEIRARGLELLSENVRAMHKKISTQFKTSSERMEGFGTCASEDTTKVRDGISPFISSILDSITTLRTDMESTTMAEYVSTGQTPQKRDWTYPNTLPKTIPSPKPETKLREISNPSPSKSRPASPTKMNSPSKTKVFTDAPHGPLPSLLPESSTIPVGGELGTLSKVSPRTHHPSTATSLEASLQRLPTMSLRELDINTLSGPLGGRPPSASDNANFKSITSNPDITTINKSTEEEKSIFSKSLNGGAPPQLRRNRSDNLEGSKLPTANKMTSVGKRGTAREKENDTMIVEKVISGQGRRLRSSPSQ
ncbi:putative kinesin family protein [Phaeomoniella chlamydospora]|uniref:Putative kinesin family protein n=1 Tax=Phaeomoniella chlamydospora TaxID=158046 RepID=A0A0G2DYN6_PHACM|nr:putative kinesin family protein [Phaeomoniella chlamydospora]